ncbi:MAG: glycosyltransferase family 2 protein [Oligoflexales bacterium]
MTDMPLVSIITPSYNSASFIAVTIESVLAQTYCNWEMIVCDDASEDDSREVIDRYAEKDSRIRPILLEKNLGVANARNVALQESRGEFIAFLDSDDVWNPEKLKRQVEFCLSRNADFCYSSYRFIDEQGNVIGAAVPVKSSVSYSQLLKRNTIPCLTAFIRRSTIGDLKFSDIGHEDYLFWLQILKKNGINAFGLSDNLAFYRLRARSRSSNKARAAKWVWNIYRNDEGLNLFQSGYYFCYYVSYNLWKHIRRRVTA